jgi:putative membrane protein
MLTISISGLAIVLGVFLIRAGKREAHKKAMITASVFALIFVFLYILRNVLQAQGLVPVGKYEGPYRGLFLFILWSHTALAIVNFPLAVITLRYALKGLFEKHRKIAPITAFVWIYVAVTGWLIFYFMQFLNR